MTKDRSCSFPILIIASALGCLSLAGCRDVPSPLDVDPEIQFSRLTLKVPEGGNPHVHFLPPIAPEREYTGTFDGSLSPEVLMYAGEATPCLEGQSREDCPPVVAHFTGEGRGPSVVRVDHKDEHYIVNWQVPGGPLGTTYRILLREGDQTLGYAFVSQLRGTLPITFRIEEGALNVAVAPVGEEGGTVTTKEETATVEIPPGALTTEEPITVEPVEPDPVTDEGVIEGTLHRFGPEGTTFEEPVTITLKFDPEKLPADVAPELLRLHTFEEDEWRLVEGSRVNTEKNTVSGEVTHFSLFAVRPLPVDPDEVEALFAGAFLEWWKPSHSYDAAGPLLANQTFMWSAVPANWGMVDYSGFPRIPVVNETTDRFYGNTVGYAWSQLYDAATALAAGFNALEDPGAAAALGESRVRRAMAYGRLVQGLVHGSLALLYDEAFVVDETTDLEGTPVLRPYQEVLQAALGYFDQAITLANQGGFDPLSEGWMTVTVTPDELARIAHSMKARYRANVPRDPAERAAVDWNAIVVDVNAGVQDGWFVMTDRWGDVNHLMGVYMSHPTWAQASYFVFGMADQSGMYQDWLSYPPGERHPNFPDGSPRIILTPDLRFPQGATRQQQEAIPGMAHVLTGSPHLVITTSQGWFMPGRGTHRWSHYRSAHMDFLAASGTHPTPEITPAEMRLLKAEGLLRLGIFNEAATLVNVSRVTAGLNATDAQGTNTSCVPKLPDGTCGDLFEMLKWEKRLETMLWGVHSNSWYFDGRGWGDLYRGTQTTLPVPCGVREQLLQPCNTFGGNPGERGSSPGSSYNYPYEDDG